MAGSPVTEVLPQLRMERGGIEQGPRHLGPLQIWSLGGQSSQEPGLSPSRRWVVGAVVLGPVVYPSLVPQPHQPGKDFHPMGIQGALSGAGMRLALGWSIEGSLGVQSQLEPLVLPTASCSLSFPGPQPDTGM